MHVLGLPPAFALSQDQTLKLDENFTRLITTFDEVPLLFARAQTRRDCSRSACRLHDNSVDLKRRPPKSLSGRSSSRESIFRRLLQSRKRPARTPPSTFLFLLIHLSNSPEPSGSTPQRTGEPTKLEPPTARRPYPTISEELQRRAIAP